MEIVGISPTNLDMPLDKVIRPSRSAITIRACSTRRRCRQNMEKISGVQEALRLRCRSENRPGSEHPADGFQLAHERGSGTRWRTC